MRERFFAELRASLERAEPGSLASLVESTPGDARTEPDQQVPQWLFAFDATAMATFRALALLAAHPEERRRARDELAGRDLGQPQDLPFLRACLLESVRLWPTTPAILRDTTEETSWEHGTLPADTGLVIFTPFFQRDDSRLPYADTFAPDVWRDGYPPDGLPLVPFSGGPAECPGRNLVLYLASSLMAMLLAERDLQLAEPAPLGFRGRLPATLSPFRVRLALT